MSSHVNRHFRDPRVQFAIDVKRFSREKSIPTPAYAQTPNLYKKIQIKNNDKIRQSQPSSFSSSLSKHISQKNMKTKRKLSSGFQIIKTNHHSVSIDHHLLKEKYQLIRQNFEEGKYQKVVPMIKHSILHFEYSQEQKNLYYWLALSLGHLHRYDQALEEISECLQLYPSFQEGLLVSAQLNAKLKQFKVAIEHIDMAIKMNPKNQECYLQLAFCYSLMGQFKKQRDLLQSMLDKFPKELIFLMLFIECCINLGQTNDCQQHVRNAARYGSRADSLFLYILGLMQRIRGNQQQAYILFQESLKYNSNKIAVNRSLLEVIKIDIEGRDFYKAYHSVGRIKHLELEESEEIRIYSTLIEGVMTMMKKKSQEAITILLKIANNKKCLELGIHSLVLKYLAYGYFKTEEYGKSLKYYNKIPKGDMDKSSQYNKLLVEGIELSDTVHHFPQSVSKFLDAAKVYPQKVQPYIYIAMTHIHKFNLSKSKEQIQRAETLIEALKQMEVANKLNPNSSNLLYHRTIIHLYFQDWNLAHEDINKCIEKAQQNLPKYFYIRGVCYSCVRDFKKAINEFSICLSLQPNHQEAHFEKAKCYFLLGSTQKGFSSLKSFIELNPDDLSIYKWIGDLLYQGKSYRDALKSYSESKGQDLDIIVMRAKCLFRTGSLNDVGGQLKLIDRNGNAEKNKIQLDFTAFFLLNSLLKNQSSKVVISAVHKLNKLLEENVVGYLFQLIDCMNLLGVASFYLQKYEDAYQSFLLVLELYQSLCEKDASLIKTEESEDYLDLRSEDIYFNITLCQLARGHVQEALNLIENEYLNIVEDARQRRKIQKLISLFEKQNGESFQWDFRNDKPVNGKLRRLEFECRKIKIKTKPVFNLYHEVMDNIYSSQVAEKIIKQFHAGYIDTMPEGPWIKRNPFGVVFTEDMMPSQNSISLEDTFRKENSISLSDNSRMLEQEESEEKRTISKKQDFLKKLQFDQGVEEKLNKLMKNKQEN